MRTTRILTLSMLAGCLAGTCLAEPPAEVDPAQVFAAFQPATETVAFLGVAATPASRAMSSQLRLPAGVGLVVQHVVTDSPAEEAGLRRDDVLHKLDDQLLVNAEQLAVLVRTFAPGDEVELTVIRAGGSTKLEATLAERQQPALGPGGRAAGAIPLHAVPNAWPAHKSKPLFAEIWRDARPKVAAKLDVALDRLLRPGSEMERGQALLRWQDDKEVVELRTVEGDAWRATVTDRDGQTVAEVKFRDIDELPKPIRGKVEAMLEVMADKIEEPE